jgi:hypothetical protein
VVNYRATTKEEIKIQKKGAATGGSLGSNVRSLFESPPNLGLVGNCYARASCLPPQGGSTASLLLQCLSYNLPLR